MHEVDNFFLDPEILRQTLNFLGHLPETETADSVKAALKEVATELKDWIASDWVAWEFDKSLQPPSRRISGDDPGGSLKKYAATLKERVSRATELGNLDSKVEEKRSHIQHFLDHDQWMKRLPGKQILKKYLERFPTVRAEDYVYAAASLARERGVEVAGIARLRPCQKSCVS